MYMKTNDEIKKSWRRPSGQHSVCVPECRPEGGRYTTWQTEGGDLRFYGSTLSREWRVGQLSLVDVNAESRVSNVGHFVTSNPESRILNYASMGSAFLSL
jgi:hypothetical protein